MSPEAQQNEDPLNSKVEVLFNLLVARNTMYHTITSNGVALSGVGKDMLESKFGIDEDGLNYDTLLVDVSDALVGYEQGPDSLAEIIDAVDDVAEELGMEREARVNLAEQAYRSASEYRDIDEMTCLTQFDALAMRVIGDEEFDFTESKTHLAKSVCEVAAEELREKGTYNDSINDKIRHFRDVSGRIGVSDEVMKTIEADVIIPVAYANVLASISTNNNFTQLSEGLLEDARVAAEECNADRTVYEKNVRTAVSKRAVELIQRVDDLDGALAQFEYVTRLEIGSEEEIRESATTVVASAYHKLLSALDHIHDYTADHEHYRAKVVEFAQARGVDTTKQDAKLVGRARARAIAYVKEDMQEGARRQHEYQAELNQSAGTDATKFNKAYTQEAYKNAEQSVRETMSASDYKRGECWAEAVSWLQFARDSITDKEFAAKCEDRIFGILSTEIKNATGKGRFGRWRKVTDMKRAKLALTYTKEITQNTEAYTGRNYSAQVLTLEAGVEDRPGVLTHHDKTGWLSGILR